jgi:hypothetical protein
LKRFSATVFILDGSKICRRRLLSEDTLFEVDVQLETTKKIFGLYCVQVMYVCVEVQNAA